MTQRDRTMRALNILTKWRVLFTGWQLGTRPKGEPEGDAVRDHREVTILLRAEASAMSRLLIKKGLVTEEEWLRTLEDEAVALNESYAERFPGIIANETGLTLTLPQAAETMRGWKP